MVARTKNNSPYLWQKKYDPNVYFCPCCQERVLYESEAKAQEALCEYCGTPVKGNHIQRIGKTIKPKFVRAPEDSWQDAIKVRFGYKLPRMRLKMQYGIDVTEEEKREYAKTYNIK